MRWGDRALLRLRLWWRGPGQGQGAPRGRGPWGSSGPHGRRTAPESLGAQGAQEAQEAQEARRHHGRSSGRGRRPRSRPDHREQGNPDLQGSAGRPGSAGSPGRPRPAPSARLARSARRAFPAYYPAHLLRPRHRGSRVRQNHPARRPGRPNGAQRLAPPVRPAPPTRPARPVRSAHPMPAAPSEPRTRPVPPGHGNAPLCPRRTRWSRRRSCPPASGPEATPAARHACRGSGHRTQLTRPAQPARPTPGWLSTAVDTPRTPGSPWKPSNRTIGRSAVGKWRTGRRRHGASRHGQASTGTGQGTAWLQRQGEQRDIRHIQGSEAARPRRHHRARKRCSTPR